MRAGDQLVVRSSYSGSEVPYNYLDVSLSKDWNSSTKGRLTSPPRRYSRPQMGLKQMSLPSLSCHPTLTLHTRLNLHPLTTPLSGSRTWRTTIQTESHMKSILLKLSVPTRGMKKRMRKRTDAEVWSRATY